MTYLSSFASWRSRSFSPHKLRRILREVRNDHICPGALNARQRLKNRAIAIQPGSAVRAYQCRVLSAHLLRRDRKIKLCLDSVDNIEVRHSWFHHDDVGTFLNVECHFSSGFALICRIHLVRTAVAEFWRG